VAAFRCSLTPHPSAARSILEGLDETLTVIALGVGATLSKTMRSTNPIENLQGALKRVARNVKRWRGGSMALRWAVSGLLEAQKRFRRVKCYARCRNSSRRSRRQSIAKM